MKVAAESAQTSALGTWLPGAETAQSAEAGEARPQGMAAAPAAAGPAQERLHDVAEGLLQLDVWGGAPAASRSLAAAPQPALHDAAALDQAVEHIFGPLC